MSFSGRLRPDGRNPHRFRRPAYDGIGAGPALGDHGAFTIVEALTGIVLLAILLAAVYVFMSGNITQRRHLEGYLDLQRDTRRVILRLRKDLKSLASIRRADRGPGDRLLRLVFLVPDPDGGYGTVDYAFDADDRGIRRNGRLVVSGTIRDVRFWLLDKDERDVYGSSDYSDVEAVRIRLDITTPPQPGSTPGKGRKLEARGRSLDFIIYPRIPVSRKKARQGRFNLESGRFAVRRGTGRQSVAAAGDR